MCYLSVQIVQIRLTEIISNMKMTETTPKITVAIRKRPLNKKEQLRGESDIVRVGGCGQVTVSEHKVKVDLTKYLEETTFNFDFAFDQATDNQQIYQQAIRPLIHNAFMGAKISCFAYGQTGSGKTHTMKGDINKNVPGLYYLGAQEIFGILQEERFRHLHVTVSFYEIYCGRLYDLLNQRAELKIRQDKKQNINVIGMEEKLICSANEFMDVIEYGSNFRVTSQNATNNDSSRSHAILQISLKHEKKVFTKISFIDLAGNQRGADHIDQNKQTKIDGAEINKSLLSLKECIRALDQGKGHTPFRGSKLTMVLKDSFVGFCNTVMICNVSPNSSSSENTMNTLRYADRVKELRSSQGESLTKEEQLARELMLPRANNKNCIKVNIQNNDDEDDILLKVEEARGMQGQSTQNIRINHQEEPMDIEEPYQPRKVFMGNAGRKTDNLTNEMKLFNMAQKRALAARDQKASKVDNFTNNLKPKTAQTTALNSRNVPTNQVDQNNLNFGNNSIPQYDLKRPIKLFPRNASEPNRTNFQAVGALKRDFDNYREDHESLVKAEMSIMKEEMCLKEQHRGSSNSYEEEIQDVNVYLQRMDNCIRLKLEVFKQMQSNLEKMRSATRSVEALTRKSAGQLGSSPSGVQRGQRPPFNNFNPLDEQLLEGLPGDELMTRLF